MSDEFFVLLTERIVKTKMSSQRLEYAVNNVIDNFRYNQLNIADILSTDIRCRVLSYHEMVDEVNRCGGSTESYAPLYLRGFEKPFWITKADKARYNLPERL